MASNVINKENINMLWWMLCGQRYRVIVYVSLVDRGMENLFAYYDCAKKWTKQECLDYINKFSKNNKRIIK